MPNEKSYEEEIRKIISRMLLGDERVGSRHYGSDGMVKVYTHDFDISKLGEYTMRLDGINFSSEHARIPDTEDRASYEDENVVGLNMEFNNTFETVQKLQKLQEKNLLALLKRTIKEGTGYSGVGSGHDDLEGKLMAQRVLKQLSEDLGLSNKQQADEGKRSRF